MMRWSAPVALVFIVVAFDSGAVTRNAPARRSVKCSLAPPRMGTCNNPNHRLRIA